MTNLHTAAKLALEALEDFADVIKYDNEQNDIGARVCCDVLSYNPHTKDCKAVKAITTLRQALEQQPAAREPLTDEQIKQIYTEQTGSFIDDSPWALLDFARAIEAAHGIKEKNSG